MVLPTLPFGVVVLVGVLMVVMFAIRVADAFLRKRLLVREWRLLRDVKTQTVLREAWERQTREVTR